MVCGYFEDGFDFHHGLRVYHRYLGSKTMGVKSGLYTDKSQLLLWFSNIIIVIIFIMMMRMRHPQQLNNND